MVDKNNNANGLTLLCPIKKGSEDNRSYSEIIRNHLENLPLDSKSPMSKIPNTYMCRFYVLNDVFYEAFPANEEHLQSSYLVFSSNYYGDLDQYLHGIWDNGQEPIQKIWKYCWGFEGVNSADEFAAYIKNCMVNNNLFFNGSTGEPLAEQLKSLYLKQELSKFVYDHQGASAQDLQSAFKTFVERTQPANLSGPTWEPGFHE